MASVLNMPPLNHSFQEMRTMVFDRAPTISTMVEFKERLKLAMDHAKVSRESLRAELDVTRVAIDKLLDGRSKAMSTENCAKAARFMGVSIYWLATGAGEMLEPKKYSTTPLPAPLASETDSNPFGWPMKTVSAREYNKLSEFQRGLIEGEIRQMLKATEDKSNGGSAAA